MPSPKHHQKGETSRISPTLPKVVTKLLIPPSRDESWILSTTLSTAFFKTPPPAVLEATHSTPTPALAMFPFYSSFSFHSPPARPSSSAHLSSSVFVMNATAPSRETDQPWPPFASAVQSCIACTESPSSMSVLITIAPIPMPPPRSMICASTPGRPAGAPSLATALTVSTGKRWRPSLSCWYTILAIELTSPRYFMRSGTPHSRGPGRGASRHHRRAPLPQTSSSVTRTTSLAYGTVCVLPCAVDMS
jgi:hypothetical protein